MDSQYCTTASVRGPARTGWKPSSPLPSSLTSSFSIRGIADVTGSQLRSARKRLMRIPMRKTTTSPSAAAVIRPSIGFSLMAFPQ